jgi:hypothetical protein
MMRQLALFISVVSAVFGFHGSTVLAQVSPQSRPFTISHEHADPHPASDAHAHPALESMPHGHSHGSLDIPANAPVPTVDLVIHPDAQQGWNLEVQVTNFAFAPERVNQSSVTTEGHAHLFINGEKITRLYGGWYYLAPLPPGEYEVSVVLNANTHEDLVHNGQVIRDVEILTVPPSP